MFECAHCNYQSRFRAPRSKGKAALGQLVPIADLPRMRCCMDNCVMVSLMLWFYDFGFKGIFFMKSNSIYPGYIYIYICVCVCVYRVHDTFCQLVV